MNSSKHNNLMLKMVSLIYVIHVLIAFVTYKVVAAYINTGNVIYAKAANLPLPSQGEALFIFAFLATLILSIVITILIGKAFKRKFDLAPRVGVREFVLLNLVPIIVLLIVITLFFDPLVSVAVYLAFFVILIYFRDY